MTTPRPAAARRDPPLGPAAGAVFAVAAFAAALGARFALQDTLPAGFPFLTFFPAVILTCFLCGTGPAVLCAALSGLAAWRWFMPPAGAFQSDAATAIALGFFVAIVAVDIVLIEVLRRGARRLRAKEEQAAALARTQRALFAELQHRVANNLAFVVSLLSLHRESAAADPARAARTLDDAMERLEVMGRLHRRLHDPDALERPLEEHVRGLCAEVLDAAGAEGVECRVAVEDARLDLQRLTVLSLVLTELMTNSVKHAFRGRPGGTIHVRLSTEGGRVALSVGDDGPGMPEGAAASESLGLRIVRALADQLGARLHLPGPGESTTRVVFDL